MALDRSALYLQLLASEHLTGDETLLWQAIANDDEVYVYCRDCTRDFCLDQPGRSPLGHTWASMSHDWDSYDGAEAKWIKASKFQDEEYEDWECAMCRKPLRKCRVRPVRSSVPAAPGE
jgi:hypothetical protein